VELKDRITVSLLNSNVGESVSPIAVYNSYDLIRKFGLPQEENYKSWFCIYNYLKYQNVIYVMRPLSVLSESKMLDIYDDVIPVKNSITDFYNSTVADVDNLPSDANSVFSVIERYCNSEEDTAVVICDNISSWKNPLTNEYVDKVISRSLTEAPSDPEDQDTYIIPDGAIGEWSGLEGNLAIATYDPSDNLSWSIISISEGASYYIEDEETEIYKSGILFVERLDTYTYIDYDIHTYIRQIYSGIQDNDGEIKKCYQLINITPDFDNGEFAVFVFKKNSAGLFSLIEKYIASTVEDADNYYTYINTNSNHIYIKYFSGSANTTNYSIINNTLMFDDTPYNFISVLPADWEATVDEIDMDDFNMILNCEIDSSMDYIPTKCIDTSCMCITAMWNNYTTLTDIINDFGIYAENPTGYTIFNRNNLIIANFKKQYDEYNDKTRYIPVAGDVAGTIITDKVIDYSDGSYINLYGFEDEILLKENKINILNNNWKYYFTSEPNKAKFKYGFNSLISNKIEKYVSNIINNNDITYKPPLERYKDRIYSVLKIYLDSLCNVDINSYVLDIEIDEETKIINIIITISYYQVIETIVVNFYGDFSGESFTMSYKEK